MEAHRVRHLVVTRAGEVRGMLSIRDLLRAFYMEQSAMGF